MSMYSLWYSLDIRNSDQYELLTFYAHTMYFTAYITVYL